MKKIVATLTRTNGTLTRSLGLVTSFVFTVMLLAQLYTFDRFPEVMTNTLSIDAPIASIVCGAVVLIELLSLPFLLNIPLSRLMRILSIVSGFVVLGFWVYVGFVAHDGSDSSRNIGIAGDTVIIPGGWWFVYCLAGLFITYVWYVVRMSRGSK